MHFERDDRAITNARRLVQMLRVPLRQQAEGVRLLNAIDAALRALNGQVSDGRWHRGPLQNFRAFAGMLSAASMLAKRDLAQAVVHLRRASATIQQIQGQVRNLSAEVRQVEDAVVQQERAAGSRL